MSFRRSDYGFTLPPGAIARRPPAERTAARLLVLAREANAAASIEHLSFGEIGRHLRRGDCLVLNETRVVPARLLGVRRETGGRLELLLVRRRGPAATVGESETWEALGRPGKRLRPGTAIELGDGALPGEVIEDLAGGRRLVRLTTADQDLTVAEMISRHGHMPLPPYIDRADDARDRTDYQTVYARVPGAVAAPTAGLHFTDALLAELEAAGVAIARLVLHVGPGTFKPVTADDVRDHRLEAERYVLTEENAARIRQARAGGGRIVAVGTTVVRTLEARARDAAADGGLAAGDGEADLFIYPPFEFRIVDAMITNFHLPESTLLMLVAAFAGRERTLAAYREAVQRGYRFYSYGDAMLIA